MSKAKVAGRKANGNVTIDLGETIEKKLRTAGMAGRGRSSRAGYRPGMFGYRPWSHSSGKLGWKLGDMLKLPSNLSPKDTLTGAVIGTVGNRILRFLTPRVLGTNSQIMVDAVNFGVGLVPYLVQRNSMTVGIALPGLVYLAGDLADWALDKVGVLGARPALVAMAGRGGSLDAAVAARQKLAEIQARIGQQARVAQQRVQARPQYVA